MMNKMMKKLAIVLAAATMAITATSVTASAYTQYVNNDIGLNVRLRPDKSSPSLGGLDRGDAVDVVEKYSDGWVKINYNGQTAYVRNCLQDAKPQDNPQRHSGDTYTVGVQSGYLALRTSPRWTDDDSNVIEEMYNGQRFTVTDRCGQYWYGYSNRTGNYGYVNSDYLY